MFCILVLACLTLPATAQVAAPAPASSDSRAPCVDVAINDHPALSYDCLNRRLSMAATAPAQPAIELDAVTHEPGNRQVGQYNVSALSHRMGANLGHSAQPQRPPPSPPPPNPFPTLTVTH
jgi:hypothetical protein